MKYIIKVYKVYKNCAREIEERKMSKRICNIIKRSFIYFTKKSFKFVNMKNYELTTLIK